MPKETTTPSKMSIDELLNQQTQVALTATIEPIADEPTLVKVTPFVANSGCLCSLAMRIPKDAISHVTPTGETHYCCGKQLLIVEVHFRDDASLSVKAIFEQLHSNAQSQKHPEHAHQAQQPMPAPFATPSFAGPQIVCPFGYQPCVGSCGAHCYHPAGGENCYDGQVCPFGYRQCGCGCYYPAGGETCHMGHVVSAMSSFQRPAFRGNCSYVGQEKCVNHRTWQCREDVSGNLNYVETGNYCN